MNPTDTLSIEAEPYAFAFTPATCALLIVDMQRDFLEPGGFGEALATTFRAFAAPSLRISGSSPLGAPSASSCCTREKAIAPTSQIFPGEKARAAAPRSAIPGRWGASSFAANADTTSFPNSLPARRAGDRQAWQRCVLATIFTRS